MYPQGIQEGSWQVSPCLQCKRFRRRISRNHCISSGKVSQSPVMPDHISSVKSSPGSGIAINQANALYRLLTYDSELPGWWMPLQSNLTSYIFISFHSTKHHGLTLLNMIYYVCCRTLYWQHERGAYFICEWLDRR